MKNSIKFLLAGVTLLLLVRGQLATATVNNASPNLPTFTYSGVTYMTTPGGCTDSKTPTCAGGEDTVRETWNDGGSEYVAVGATSDTDGASNTAKLANHPYQVHYAAKYCDDMVYGGYDDWFLPAIDELNQMYLNMSSIGGFPKNSAYWSSTEYPSKFARPLWMMEAGGSKEGGPKGGWQFLYYAINKENANYVRCVRKSTGTNGNRISTSGSGMSSSGSIKVSLNTSKNTTFSTFSYGGRVYMTTPGGCTDSKTPTCAGGEDTVMKNWIGAKRYCADMVYGGYSDWVLPRENFGFMFFKQIFETRYTIGGFRNDNYWSSGFGDGFEWMVNMSDGQYDTDSIKTPHYVRCVRKTEAKNLPYFYYGGVKYMTTPGGCTDSKTPTCVGGTDSITKNWSASKKYCDDMVYGGYTDWFLPDNDQLDSLLKNKSVVGGLSSDSWSGLISGYWSSKELDSEHASIQTNGYNFQKKDNVFKVRCIRKSN